MKTAPAALPQRSPAPHGWPTCRSCGCWEYAACWNSAQGACWWTKTDLCSHCTNSSNTE